MPLSYDASDVQSFMEVSRAFMPFLGIAGALTGLYLIGSAGVTMFKAGANPQGHQGDAPVGQVVLVKSIIGALFLQFSRSVEMTRELMGGAGVGVREGLAYAVPAQAGGGFWGAVMAAGFLWLSVIGTIAIFRGFLLWVKAGSGENSRGGGDDTWAGFWHIVAGGIAINIGS